MHQALRLAVESGMRFDTTDIKTISKEMRMGYWIGENGIEMLYASGCGGERGTANPSAVAAIETYLSRKPFLWAEETKTSGRLYVGRRFNWLGNFVTITSFSGDNSYLTAVTHKDDGRTPDRRFKITLKELTETRKEFDRRRKGYEKEIEEASTLEVLDSINQRIVNQGRATYRHFDIEILREAYQNAKKRIESELSHKEALTLEAELAKTHDSDLKRWMAGEDVRRHFNVVRLRVRDEWVETSTFQRATIVGVRKAIKWALPFRTAGWSSNSQSVKLDNFPVRSITPEGCQVGCTFVPWSEIDRIAPQLIKGRGAK